MHGDQCGIPDVVSLRDVKVGEKRDGVQQIQSYLRQFGFLRGVENEEGVFDEPTENAMRLLQRTWNISEDRLFSDHTRALMVQPRCGMSDANVSAGFSINCDWAERTLRYTRGRAAPQFKPDHVWREIDAAMETWSIATGINFVFHGLEPHFEVAWIVGEDPHYDAWVPVMAHENMAGPSINIAHADYPPGCSVYTSTTPKPVHFNGYHHVTWTINGSPGAFDIQTVALHQIGHLLGFAHSSDSNSVMYPFFSPGLVKRQLTETDRRGAKLLYPYVPQVQHLSKSVAETMVWNAGLRPFFMGDETDQSWVSTVSPQVGSAVSPNSTVNMQLSSGPLP